MKATVKAALISDHLHARPGHSNERIKSNNVQCALGLLKSIRNGVDEFQVEGDCVDFLLGAMESGRLARAATRPASRIMVNMRRAGRPTLRAGTPALHIDGERAPEAPTVGRVSHLAPPRVLI